MDQDRTSWPIVVGITAGIIGGLIVGVYLYSARAHEAPEVKLRDAKEVITQCHERIKEIEAGLEALKQPLPA